VFFYFSNPQLLFLYLAADLSLFRALFSMSSKLQMRRSRKRMRKYIETALVIKSLLDMKLHMLAPKS